MQCLHAQDKLGHIDIDTSSIAVSKITINDGLSQGMVTSIVQDQHGFMWFGTKDGLNRFDGYTFKIFRRDALDSNSVRENTITSLYCDKYGRLWVGTSFGLDLFDAKTERFIHLPIISPDGDWGSVVYIILDDNNDLWISTTSTMVKVTFSKNFSDYNVPSFSVKWCGKGYATISRTSDGKLWGNINEVTFRLTPSHDKEDKIDTLSLLRFKNNDMKFGALTIIEDTVRRKLYGLYNNGIVQINPLSGEITYLIRDDEELNWLQALNPVVDKKGMIWLCTFRGLYKFDPFQRKLIMMRSTDPDLRANISSLKWTFIDRSGTLWLGTLGYGLLKYDPRIERFNNWSTSSVRGLSITNNDQLIISHYDSYLSIFDPINRRSSAFIKNIIDKYPNLNGRISTPFSDYTVEDRKGLLWSFISAGTLSYYDPVSGKIGLIKPEISPGVMDDGFQFPLYIDSHGMMWTGGNAGCLRFNTETKEYTRFDWPVPVLNNPYPFVTSIIEGTNGDIWMGTMKGVLCLNPATKQWKNYVHIPEDSTSLSLSMVFSLCADPIDPQNILWIGTNGGGLNRLDIRNGKFKFWTMRQGLPNDVVYGVLSDDLGYLWMSTNKGIARFDPRTNTFRNFNAGDGLQSDEFNRYAYCKDKKGWLYFGGISGFNYFDPHALVQDSTPVVVKITGIRLINKPVEFGKAGSPLQIPVYLSSEIEIPYSSNMITFTFATMEFAAPELHEYRYILEGFDKDWIDAGKINNAVYTNLDPGEYVFRVIGRNRDGIWNKISTDFRLIVLPPWWRTWWFYSLCVLSIVGGTLIYIRNLRLQKIRLEKTVDIRTHELKYEKNRSEELLKNILPEDVANELKARGTTNAKHFDQVTVLFSDFREFTSIAEQLSATELVEELNVCFSAFDRIMEKYGIEKIKTIGDSYMAAGGVPDNSNASPYRVILAGIEMQQIILERQVERKAHGKPYFAMRLGIHTGPVVAGVVGMRKFQYDIWGDTVNIASRMESSGSIGEVNISRTTYELVKDEPELIFTPRGKVHAKGKGEQEMFFVRARSVQSILEYEPKKTETSEPIVSPTAFTSSPVEEKIQIKKSNKKLRILLAEDNEFNAMVVQGHIEDWQPDAQLTHVRNGAMAIEAVRKNVYDIIIMDIQMPEINGYDAAKSIRAMGNDKASTPIIGMSANAMKAEIDRCHEAGMNAFVPKPYKKEQLFAAIEMNIKL
jgi:class 3 adenylate cyclase/ligand-binding sensor domain-containing protein/ActR/RegA family two-component response regulator